MTIATTTNRVDAPGNGSATSFSFAPVVIFDPSNLVVTVRNSSGVETTISQGGGATNFSVAVVKYPGTGSITYPASGGTPLPSGSTIIIKRIVPVLQSVSLVNQGAYFPSIQEGEFDYLTSIDQQQQEQLSRAIVGPPNGPALSYVLPAAQARANSALGFDAAGNVTIYPPGTVPAGTTAINISYTAPFTGAATRTAADKFFDIVSVKDAGAKGDGATDDTAAIQRAVDTGKTVFFPANAIYKTSAPIVLNNNGQLILGGGINASVTTNSATAVIFSITGQLVELCGLQLNSSVTRTAGGGNCFIDIVNTGYVHIHDMLLQNFASGIRMSGSGVAGIRIRDVTMNLGHTGAAIEINNGVDVVLSDVLISGTSPSVQLASGVTIFNVGDVTLRHVSTVYGGNGLSIAPGIGQVIQALFVEHCLFDSGNGAGIDVEATGFVQLMKITDTWACSNVAGGIILNTHGGGVIQQTDIIACIGSNNGNHGVLINTAAVTGTTIMGGSFGANSGSGITVAAGCSRFKIMGVSAGICGEFVGNASYGINIGAGCDIFTLGDNTLLSNGVGAVNLGAPGGTYGVTWRIHDNIGFPTVAFGILSTTSGPSTFNVAHGLPITPALTDVQLTLMTSPGAAANFWPGTPGVTTFPITFNTAPGGSIAVGWKIAMFGG